MIKIIKTQWLVPKILGDATLKKFFLNWEEYFDNINDKIIMAITGEHKLFKEKVEKH